jgi:hypothetical protein
MTSTAPAPGGCDVDEAAVFGNVDIVRAAAERDACEDTECFESTTSSVTSDSLVT